MVVPTRWVNHRSLLRSGKHHSTKLQRAWDKNGEEAFLFEVLETCSEDVVEDREQFWIIELKAFGHGYNMRPEAGKQGRLSMETRRLIGEAQKRCGQKPELVALRREIANRLHAEGRIGAKNWTPEQRLKVSEGLRRYWATRKADASASGDSAAAGAEDKVPA